MATESLPSQSFLNQLLRYEPDTGLLFWKERPVEMFVASPARSAEWKARNWNSKLAGRPAFAVPKPNGYLHSGLTLPTGDKRNYYAHRVIWKMVTGEDPEFIDHINGSRADNRFLNLRDVTKAENRRNSRQTRNAKLLAMGVNRGSKNCWYAVIGVNNETIYLGSFRTFDEALRERKAAERRYGFHPNHGSQTCKIMSG